MSRPRTYTREEVLSVLAECTARSGRPPTILELTVELGFGSTRTTLRYLQDLEDHGLIRRLPGARGVQLIKESCE